METQVRTPQMVFMQPQRLLVPLFQRPYVWNQENQWEPLWEDVVRGAERLLKEPSKRQPHFLGAVVLQQSPNVIGLMQNRTVIDGQQRLTTIQLLLDALHAELLAIGAAAPAARIEPLVTNAPPFCSSPEDRFKVWPTNRDRPAFNAVMGAVAPVKHDAIGHPGERLVEAHRFFSEQARQWLTADTVATSEQKASAIELMVREFLPMVVIDLSAEENAQEIFETLNARGAQLSAADLIKNFIFQRLAESGTDVEKAYEQHWKEFETGFWEAEVSVGRVRYPRSAIFLNHWLIARTGEEVVAREVFDRFKRFASEEAGIDMIGLLVQLHRASQVYRRFVTATTPQPGAVDRRELFGYRTGVLESEIIKPLLLCLFDPEAAPISDSQITKALDCVESWMVRRMLVRATTKNYGQAIAELVALVRMSDRGQASDVIERHLQAQSGESKYWPDDSEVRAELETLPIYRRVSRSRLRMVLEAIEDHERGWKDDKVGLGGERVARGKYTIEHIMPRKWAAHWPLPAGRSETERDKLLDTVGNLTLLTKPLNSKVSNGPWSGQGAKREGIGESDVLLLNRELLKAAADAWTDEGIGERTGLLCSIIAEVWPVPAGHRSVRVTQSPRRRRKIKLPDLIAAGVLEAGMVLYPRRKAFAGRTAILLSDGQIEVDGKVFVRPSDAATQITGKRTNGWEFFLADPASKHSLRNLRSDYVSTMAGDVDDDDEDGDGDEDDD